MYATNRTVVYSYRLVGNDSIAIVSAIVPRCSSKMCILFQGVGR